jgi:hypothetical protein
MATARALKPIEGIRASRKHHDSWEDVLAQEARKLDGNELVFTCIRNPYDWILTAFMRWRATTQIHDLATFVRQFDRDPFIREGRIYWQAKPDAVNVWRYETIERDLNLLLSVYDLAPIELPRTNVTNDKRKPWRDYYTRDAIDAVNDRFADEFSQWYDRE